MKPIEAGCLCLIIQAENPEHVGENVVAVRVNKPLTEEYGETIWMVDGGAPPPTSAGWCSKEAWLLRIDGHEPETQDVPEELTV